MEPPNDDEFDALWEKAAAEANRLKPRPRLSLVPKEPTERRKPRPASFPALASPQSQPRPKFVSPVQPRRQITAGGDSRPKIEPDSVRRTRNTVMGLSLPVPLEPAGASPKFERKTSEPPRGKMMRRHSSMDIDGVASSHSPSRSSRQNSALTVSDELFHDSVRTQISFSNLPELTELMKKPSIGTAATATAATAASDYSSAKQLASKNWSDNNSDQLKKTQYKKVAVDDAQRKVADYILDLPTHNGSSTPLLSLPAIHSISSFKENKDQLSGLVISRDSGCEVLVRKITPTSIFAETPLKEDHEILTINNRRVKCPLRATTIIKSIKGEVNLLVSEGIRPPGTKYIKAKVEKQQSDSIAESISEKESSGNKDLGLTLEESRYGLVRVVKVDENSVFGSTPIRENDIVLAVNGESAQSVDVVMTSLGKFYDGGGVAIVLVYSMFDLRLGLVDRILPSPWEIHWDENLQGATISKPRAAGEDASVSFCVVFDDDWSCDLIPSDSASPGEKEEVNLVVDRLNDAISRATKCWSDAIQVSKEDLFTAAC
ncbi:hypothetical protein ACHAWO_002396 [Cyclotella atomus]|uniref:PDZ domain-containing protein n=1 Tax=Cyclotella atomus TaxID=382360 RepID=A0ABD3QHG4_9STRA